MGFLDRLRSTDREVSEVSVPAEAEMLIGAPEEAPPDSLVAALREGAEDHPEISAAYLFQMMILAEGEEPHLTLGLELDGRANVMRISNDLGRRARQVLPEGSYVDVYPLPDDMAETVRETVEPFYERGN